MRISLPRAGEQIRDDPYELVRQRFLSSLRGLSKEERTELRHSITNLNHYIEKMASTPR